MKKQISKIFFSFFFIAIIITTYNLNLLSFMTHLPVLMKLSSTHSHESINYLNLKDSLLSICFTDKQINKENLKKLFSSSLSLSRFSSISTLKEDVKPVNTKKTSSATSSNVTLTSKNENKKRIINLNEFAELIKREYTKTNDLDKLLEKNNSLKNEYLLNCTQSKLNWLRKPIPTHSSTLIKAIKKPSTISKNKPKYQPLTAANKQSNNNKSNKQVFNTKLNSKIVKKQTENQCNVKIRSKSCVKKELVNEQKKKSLKIKPYPIQMNTRNVMKNNNNDKNTNNNNNNAFNKKLSKNSSSKTGKLSNNSTCNENNYVNRLKNIYLSNNCLIKKTSKSVTKTLLNMKNRNFISGGNKRKSKLNFENKNQKLKDDLSVRRSRKTSNLNINEVSVSKVAFKEKTIFEKKIFSFNSKMYRKLASSNNNMMKKNIKNKSSHIMNNYCENILDCNTENDAGDNKCDQIEIELKQELSISNMAIEYGKIIEADNQNKSSETLLMMLSNQQKSEIKKEIALEIDNNNNNDEAATNSSSNQIDTFTQLTMIKTTEQFMNSYTVNSNESSKNGDEVQVSDFGFFFYKI